MLRSLLSRVPWLRSSNVQCTAAGNNKKVCAAIDYVQPAQGYTSIGSYHPHLHAFPSRHREMHGIDCPSIRPLFSVLLLFLLLAFITFSLFYFQRQLVLLIATKVRITHQIKRVRVLACLRCSEVELHLRILHQRDPLEAEQRIRLRVAYDEPPPLFLLLGEVWCEHFRHTSFLAFALKLHCDAHWISRRDLVGVLDLEREVNIRVAIAGVGDIKELSLRETEKLHASVIFHIHEIKNRLDACCHTFFCQLLADMRKLQQHWVSLPHCLHAHLRHFHGGKGWCKPPR
mmetsp:Transcript_38208/g.95026  ORF Transcript_38208/g.95026 Transcript_38208/m.95026 type:complete len:287 (-) Transcript_38208:2058-2918(-)